ncbi:hypothetical protein P7K49_018956 [Saguinus oedipus]|uniref:Protein-tyrosine-phosphatase n=1 Tax=Saguinus oedipus TaxID=9490 RepID=A0ABQ9UWU4_SAGOE|nr:hypothetical protein P7K49_018956 [Saguinus oedipus]
MGTAMPLSNISAPGSDTTNFSLHCSAPHCSHRSVTVMCQLPRAMPNPSRTSIKAFLLPIIRPAFSSTAKGRELKNRLSRVGQKMKNPSNKQEEIYNEPAPPKSLFAVNKTQTSVTLLWVEEGIADFFEVFCQQVGSSQKTKLQEPVAVSSHVVTISSLLPATAYNCSVTSFSHDSPSVPTFIAVSTMVTEMNPNVVVISVLAILSTLLIGLLLVTLIILRKKHLQMARSLNLHAFIVLDFVVPFKQGVWSGYICQLCIFREGWKTSIQLPPTIHRIYERPVMGELRQREFTSGSSCKIKHIFLQLFRKTKAPNFQGRNTLRWSNQSMLYVCLTGFFIDLENLLQRKGDTLHVTQNRRCNKGTHWLFPELAMTAGKVHHRNHISNKDNVYHIKSERMDCELERRRLENLEDSVLGQKGEAIKACSSMTQAKKRRRRKTQKKICPVQLDDFDAYIKDMAKDSDYKFSLQFEARPQMARMRGSGESVQGLSERSSIKVPPDSSDSNVQSIPKQTPKANCHLLTLLQTLRPEYSLCFPQMIRRKSVKQRGQFCFKELKLIGLDIPHFAADLPLNRCKNRYTNILPYDFSRVRLISMNEEEGADYINANYIPGYNSPQEYIATQGPLPETRNDFWKMVLQQKSQIIVMLTQCNEKRRVKCDHYWPFTEEPVAYGDITVEMISEEERDDWACRHFRINYPIEYRGVVTLNSLLHLNVLPVKTKLNRKILSDIKLPCAIHYAQDTFSTHFLKTALRVASVVVDFMFSVSKPESLNMAGEALHAAGGALGAEVRSEGQAIYLMCGITGIGLIHKLYSDSQNQPYNAQSWMTVSNSNEADEMQDVMHFNYTAWPDHGVPTANAAESILQFVHMVRQQAIKSKGPMIIHCSSLKAEINSPEYSAWNHYSSPEAKTLKKGVASAVQISLGKVAMPVRNMTVEGTPTTTAYLKISYVEKIASCISTVKKRHLNNVPSEPSFAVLELLQHIRDHEFVDILGLVSEMRSYRMSMVQTEKSAICVDITPETMD